MSGIITITTGSGGIYEVDSAKRMYRKSGTTKRSQVGVTDWRRYHTISEWLDDGRHEIGADEIRVGYGLEFNHSDYWNVTSKVKKVEVAG